MTQSLTGSWTKEITAGYAPPASEETGIRYPCPQRVLEEIADEVECLLYDAVGTDENCFNPDEYYVPASHITKLTSLLQKLAEVEE